MLSKKVNILLLLHQNFDIYGNKKTTNIGG
jgi:hypothetical protein